LSGAVQIAGSLLILVPFVLSQAGRMASSSAAYLGSNFVGSAVLAVDAAYESQWGFLMLEGVWALVSLVSLLRLARRGRQMGRPSRTAAP